MLWTFTLKRTLLAIVAISCLTSPVAAEPKPATGGGLAVDVVSLKSGRSLRGVIAWQEPSGSLTMAVSRDGLAATNRPLSDSALKENLEGRQAGWAQSRERILERLKRPLPLFLVLSNVSKSQVRTVPQPCRKKR